MIKRLIQIPVKLLLIAMIIASPMAFNTGLCAGSSCCCAPEPTDELSFSRNSCCQCGDIVPAEKPVQEAVINVKISVDPVRPELEALESESQNLFLDNNFSKNNHNISTHPPPGDVSLLFAPLLC